MIQHHTQETKEWQLTLMAAVDIVGSLLFTNIAGNLFTVTEPLTYIIVNKCNHQEYLQTSDR